MDDKQQELENNIRQLEAAKASGALPASVADASIAALRAQLATYTATAHDGAIAQDNSKAAGKQAVLANDVTNSTINTGSVNYFLQVYHAPAGRSELSEQDFARILTEYLRWVVRAYDKARLYGIESTASTRSQPRRTLNDVFVPLALRRFNPPSRDEIEQLAREQFKGDPLAQQRAYLAASQKRRESGETIVLKALLTLKNRLAVIGGAGSGKSTLAAYLAANLARAAYTGSNPGFTLPKNRRQLLPLLIPLRYYREYQHTCAQASTEKLRNPRTGKLPGFIAWYLMRRSPALELSQDFFDRLLLGGGCLMILDGLDEVVNRSERADIRAQVENLANDTYPGNLFLVTARESGYRDDAVFGDDFQRLDVEPLTDAQIEMLVRNWCEQLYPESVQHDKGKPQNQTAELLEAIGTINRRYQAQKLPPLITTPLMTTMVVSVKWGESELPRERARLYEAAVKVILQAQYLEPDDAQRELVNWGGSWEEQREWLAYLALEMQRGGQNGAALTESGVRAILETYPGMTAARLNTFLKAVRERGGLFEERAELFQFVHLTFQEFLAARRLVKQREKGLENLKDYLGDSWWREVCLLFYGYAKDDFQEFAQQYLNWVDALTPHETRLQGLELTAMALLEIEKPAPDLRRAQAEKLARLLTDAKADTRPQTRARAGNTLALLGDPRFDAEHWYLPKEPGLGFVHIAAGEFVMGSDPKVDHQAHDGKDGIWGNEQPQHKVTLPEYWVARYPVTVAQYRAFVESSGYQTGYEDSLRGIANHPVMYVYWRDALAYTRWLDEQMKTWARSLGNADKLPVENGLRGLVEGLQGGRLCVQLPSEAEWEKAARGRFVPPLVGEGREGSTARIYPWGNDPNPNFANYEDTGIGATSTVGVFPGGVSPYGVQDMSGNVWEWTRTIWAEKFAYPYNGSDGRERLEDEELARVVRGGSFYNELRGVRCAVRVGYYFSGRYRHDGFRVVVSPCR